eukprot:CAMPEP_0182422800 /NCGR_PEP_ID=MMETSP1167-20130531/8582_1 /TAXON_ID=2988 /ORGANISM="Mallomonas Sp, Strain CCMP3275" /LENGTH=726 /DNA_ID=CAMNT_0024601173 /DNA_START=169 /DNA_END=2349 /DNA_ORIENTATION=-
MANDCSERVCQFGLAHVDTPKGDLDMNGVVTDGTKLVAENSAVYPYGTPEQFPFARDSDLQDVEQTAHYYMECSNKGTCDRATGTCLCYDGYDGAACQRASCPGFPMSCSGHGVCRSIEQLANDDYGNVYKLWDRSSTMGCQCDKGYSGPDCSLRQCKHGIDPLYLDDSATIRYATYDVALLTTSDTIDFNDGTPLKGQAYWALRFYDIHGEDWVTQPIVADASCDQVAAALYALPNNVVPDGSIWCTRTSNAGVNGVNGWVNGEDTHYATGSDDTTNPGVRLIKYPLAFWQQVVRSSYGDLGSVSDKISGYIYRLKFLGNPGNIRQPEIELYLDGKRPSVVSSGGEVITSVWTDGQQGESKDYFADHCDGVTVRFGYSNSDNNNIPYYYLTGFTTAEKALLKTCLADADFDNSNNVEVYNWDYGSKNYPHIVKFVKSRTTYTDGGYYVALYYDTSVALDNLASGGTFKLLNPFFSPDDYSFGIKFQTSDGGISQSTAALPSLSNGYTNSYVGTDMFEVYTTKATLGLTSNMSQASFGFGTQEVLMSNVSYDVMRGNAQSIFDGDISCEIGANNGYKIEYVNHCLNKSDYFTMLNWDQPWYNPQHMNIYQAKKLSTKKYFASVWENSFNTGPNSGFTANLKRKGYGSYASHFETHSVITDTSINHASVVSSNLPYFVYKFFPHVDSTYEYVAECSNRGICDDTSGICNCFPGYSHDDCSEQNSLHV